MSPTWPANAARIASSSRWPVGAVASVSPSASSVFVLSPRRTVASYAFSVSMRCPSRRVARLTPRTSTPVAIGSSVPAWPTLRVPASRRTRDTTSCDVMPPDLSTTTSPDSVILVEVVVLGDLARLLVRVLLAGVRRDPSGRDLVFLGLGPCQDLVEVTRGLGERVRDEGERRRGAGAELLGDLGAEEALGRLQG